tara:strand:+ start:3186 stop:4523 length:1338 start_codon:yes stop_codon:yes gene_type:complete
MAITISGNNNLGARDMYLQRSMYNGYILTALNKVNSPQIETIQIKDFLKDEKLLIGRVDPFGNPILIDRNYLKSFSSGVGGSQVTAVNFVIDAFQDMQNKFQNALRLGKVDNDSQALGELSAKKGYNDPSDGYFKHRQRLTKIFRRYILGSGKIDEIRDFETFVPIFLDFVTQMTPRNPITETMYILTSKSSVLDSGLAIEIYEGDYGDDVLKYDLFYDDINFEYLKNLAYGHGFVIDKHIPWRLVADLNSPQMAPYIENALTVPGAKAGFVLEAMYNRPHLDDIDNVADIMLKMYNMAARLRPRSIKKASSATTSLGSSKTVFKKCTRSQSFARKLTSAREVTQLPLSYWIDKYVKVRNAETGLRYDNATLDVIIKNATDLANSLDISAAVRYTATKFDNFEHFNGSLFHDVVRFEMREDPNATGDSVDERVQRSVQASNFVIY